MKKLVLASIIYAAFIFWLSSLTAPPGAGALPYNSGHFLLYLPFGILLFLAFKELGYDNKKAFLFAIFLASAYGISDEFHQLFVAGRQADPVDWALDTVGSIVGAFFYRRFAPILVKHKSK